MVDQILSLELTGGLNLAYTLVLVFQPPAWETMHYWCV